MKQLLKVGEVFRWEYAIPSRGKRVRSYKEVLFSIENKIPFCFKRNGTYAQYFYNMVNHVKLYIVFRHSYRYPLAAYCFNNDTWLVNTEISKEYHSASSIKQINMLLSALPTDSLAKINRVEEMRSLLSGMLDYSNT